MNDYTSSAASTRGPRRHIPRVGKVNLKRASYCRFVIYRTHAGRPDEIWVDGHQVSTHPLSFRRWEKLIQVLIDADMLCLDDEASWDTGKGHRLDVYKMADGSSFSLETDGWL